jgi:hypothetical protein
VSLSYQPRCGFSISVEALQLKVRAAGPSDVRPFVPIEPEPTHPVEDACHHVGRRSLNVCIFDPEHERPAVPPCVQPVEERGARAADVQIAGR